MTALPMEQPQNKHLDPVSQFKATYAKALDVLSVSVMHTATQGWQELYQDHRKAVRKERQIIAGSLRRLAEEMELAGLSEEDEKALAECRKASTELREAECHWQKQTVGPVKAPVDHCRKIIADAMTEAQAMEDREPMLNAGLLILMREAVDASAKAGWDDDTGMASATSPDEA